MNIALSSMALSRRSHRDQSAEILDLRRQNEELRERLRQMTDELRASSPAAAIFRLTGAEENVFALLMSRLSCSKEQLLIALYGSRHAKETPEQKIIDVFICKLRKKLRPFGIEITTIWGRGYMLTAPMKDRAHRIMAEAEAAR